MFFRIPYDGQRPKTYIVIPSVIHHRQNPLYQCFLNGAPEEVARYAANIMKVYFKNERKPICIEIYYVHDFYIYS
jgi:hypothetical protein